MRAGEAKAGYSIKEKLPSFLLIIRCLSLLRCSFNGSSDSGRPDKELWERTD